MAKTDDLKDGRWQILIIIYVTMGFARCIMFRLNDGRVFFGNFFVVFLCTGSA